VENVFFDQHVFNARDQQIHSILSDLQIHAMKTGMLYDADNTRAVVQALSSHYRNSTPPSLVCDPVCVSTSGHTLLDPLAVDVLISDLFPLARLITPNKAEAELLLSHRQMPSQISNLEDMLSAAQNLLQFGSHAALLKGGHIISSMVDVARLSRQRPDVDVVCHGLFDENMEILQASGDKDYSDQLVVDVLSEGENVTLFVRPRIESKSTHGTGCTLSAAITAELAHGNDREYLNGGLQF
jgi:hydroxymethylpyrimidine/phosphomethylpyrimidine kinase / thiaminase